MIRSLACSSWDMPTSFAPSNAALSAATLTKLAKSAPEKPGVPLAITSQSTPRAIFTPFACVARICFRPSTSGLGTATVRSNRPGRTRALSSVSGVLVAASTMTPSFLRKPSSSVNSWLSVMRVFCWSFGLRAEPTASISSMNTMQGALDLAFSNRSRTRDAPTPTNISTNSDAAHEKKGTPASPATALASSVLPVPGGPTRRHPLGIFAPSAVYLSGFFRKSTTSWSSSLAPSTPATSTKVTPVSGTSWNLDLDLPKSMGPPPPIPPKPPPPPSPPCARRKRKNRPPKASRGNRRLPKSEA
mmetsp:Transcript_6932/g.28427  ORF Transcript_6932/g.28427 Transcript_6932/m.28427 type:complete len:302 (-) Transcript_6932:285-1190(-)